MSKLLDISMVFLFVSLGVYFFVGAFVLISNDLLKEDSNCYIDPISVVRVID
jgi:hypothetical protein